MFMYFLGRKSTKIKFRLHNNFDPILMQQPCMNRFTLRSKSPKYVVIKVLKMKMIYLCFILKQLSINLYYKKGKILTFHHITGKSFSEALFLASTNPQYDKRLFMALPQKIQAQNIIRTLAEHVLPMFCACSFHGLIDAKIRSSDKNLPVLAICFITYTETLHHEIKMQGKFSQHAGINWTKWPTYLLRL